MRVVPTLAQISIFSYGKITKSPPGASYVFDVQGIRDPMSNRGFRKDFPDGRPGIVQDFVREDDRIKGILDTVRMLAYLHIDTEQDKWISFAFRDHHGIWTAPAVAEIVADELDKRGYKISVYHPQCLANAAGAPPFGEER